MYNQPRGSDSQRGGTAYIGQVFRWAELGGAARVAVLKTEAEGRRTEPQVGRGFSRWSRSKSSGLESDQRRGTSDEHTAHDSEALEIVADMPRHRPDHGASVCRYNHRARRGAALGSNGMVRGGEVDPPGQCVSRQRKGLCEHVQGVDVVPAIQNWGFTIKFTLGIGFSLPATPRRRRLPLIERNQAQARGLPCPVGRARLRAASR